MRRPPFGRAARAAIAGALLAALAGPLAAQSSGSGTAFAPLTERAARSMGAPITLVLHHAPLGSVVAEIARRSGVSLAYDPALAGLDRRVSVDVRDTPAAAALLRALEGSPVRAMVSATGQLVLVPRPPRAPGRAPSGGTVRDAESGAPVAGARVELLGTRFGALARDDGAFSLGDVPPGDYLARVVRLGYRPALGVALRVEDAGGATLDVSLSRASLPLSAVVVTPGYFGMIAGSLAAPQTMSRQQIETVPQIGEDIYRAVGRLPGVTASDFSARFSVRGGSGDELYATLDGLELIEPFHLKDIESALSIIDSRAIGSVELTTGGFSAEYGDRLTGVFTMRSVDPAPEGARTSLGLSVMNARATSQGRFAEGRGGWLLSARRGYLDLAMRLADVADSIHPRYDDVFAKAQLDLRGGGRVGVHVLHAGDALRYLSDGDPNIRSRYRTSAAWLTWDSRVGTRLRQQTVVSATALGWRRRGDGRDFPTESLVVDDRRSYGNGTVRQDWSLELSRGALLKWGVDAKRERADYDYARWTRRAVLDAAREIVLQDDSVAVRLAATGTRLAAYVAPRVRLGAGVTAEAGLRWDRASHTGDALASPRLNVAWQPLAGTTVRAAWGRYTQTQALYALQAQDGVDRFFPAERAEQRVVGVERALAGGLVARLEGYDRRIASPRPRFLNASPGIETFPELTWDRVRMDPSRARARGVELSVARDAGARVDWSASYALAAAEDLVDGRWLPRAVDQRHTLHAAWAVRPASNRWRLSVAGIWHSGWPFTPAVLDVDTLRNDPRGLQLFARWAPGALRSERLPAYQRVDARYTRWFEAGSGRVALFAEVYNLLGAPNARGYYKNLDVAGRAVSVVEQRETSIPRFPSVGVTWEFGGAR